MRIAWATCATSLLLSCLLTLQVLRMRWRAGRRALRRAEFLATWRPVLFEAALGGSPALPHLDAEDEDAFMVLWNQVQDSVHSSGGGPLNHIAIRVGAAARARIMLASEQLVPCMHALRMLGHLRSPEDYDAVRPLLDDPRPYLSVTAARTLIALDPDRSLEDVLSRVASRADWPASLLATALTSANAESLDRRLRAAISGARSSVELIRLLPLVALLPDGASEEILRSVCATATDPEVIVAVLKRVRTSALRDLVCVGCQHEDWTVRTQAAAALGRIGTPADQPVLVSLLSDPQWWVRYRAAEAIAQPRFGSRQRLTELMQTLPDRYARDILAHATAEARA